MRKTNFKTVSLRVAVVAGALIQIGAANAGTKAFDSQSRPYYPCDDVHHVASAVFSLTGVNRGATADEAAGTACFQVKRQVIDSVDTKRAGPLSLKLSQATTDSSTSTPDSSVTTSSSSSSGNPNKLDRANDRVNKANGSASSSVDVVNNLKQSFDKITSFFKKDPASAPAKDAAAPAGQPSSDSGNGSAKQ